jgi:LysM repeat protein
MRHWKRLFYYLIINVFVSACTVVTILTLWQRFQPEIPLLGDINPLALITPLSPGSLFPDYLSSVETIEPTSTPVQATATPSEEQPVETPMTEMAYTVQTGDTLGAIAVKFNITVAEITEVNEIDNPEALEVGQVLIIRRPLINPATQTSLTPREMEAEIETTTPDPPRNPTPAPGGSRVIIDSVIAAGDLASERIFIKRVGTGELSLTGWQLVSESGETFDFPQLTLFENGAVFIYTKEGQTTAVALYWALDHSVWESGEKVVLLDDQGEVHATYQIP